MIKNANFVCCHGFCQLIIFGHPTSSHACITVIVILWAYCTNWKINLDIHERRCQKQWRPVFKALECQNFSQKKEKKEENGQQDKKTHVYLYENKMFWYKQRKYSHVFCFNSISF